MKPERPYSAISSMCFPLTIIEAAIADLLTDFVGGNRFRINIVSYILNQSN